MNEKKKRMKERGEKHERDALIKEQVHDVAKGRDGENVHKDDLESDSEDEPSYVTRMTREPFFFFFCQHPRPKKMRMKRMKGKGGQTGRFQQ